MADVISALRELKQSSESSVVAGTELTPDAARPAVPHPIEQWLVELILDQLTTPHMPQISLIVLAGNAGDGKSHLLRAIRHRLREEENLTADMVEWILDATHSNDRRELSTRRLDQFFAPFSDHRDWRITKPHVVAINTGAVVQFFEEDNGKPGLRDLQRVLFTQLGVFTSGTEKWSETLTRRFDRVLCIDLDRRMLLSHSEPKDDFFAKMLNAINPDDPGGILAATENACAACPSADGCPVWVNLQAAQQPHVRARLRALLLDIALEDRIHVGPRGLWHLLYQMTVGGLDAARLSAGKPPIACSDIDEISPRQSSRGIFYNALFSGAVGRGEADGSALLSELRRIDPALEFTLHKYEDALVAGLSETEDMKLTRDYAEELGVSAAILRGAGNAVDRSLGAVRRRYFLHATDPSPKRQEWLRDWIEVLRGYQHALFHDGPAQGDEVLTLLRNVLHNMYSSPDLRGTNYWRLELPWRTSQEIFVEVRVRGRPATHVGVQRVLGPDTCRPEGRRPINDEMSHKLDAIPLAIPISLRNGPDVYVTWPLYRFGRRIAELSYVANSLDSERVQHMARIANSMTAHAAVGEGVTLVRDGERVLCVENDGAGGFDVTTF